jgi:hypothetical protein
MISAISSAAATIPIACRPPQAVETRARMIRFYRCTRCGRNHHEEDAAFAEHLAWRGDRGVERAKVEREYRA